MFQHRCLDKWSLGGNLRIPGFAHEQRCFQWIEQLRQCWRPRFTAALQRLPNSENAVAGRRFILSRSGVARWCVTFEPQGWIRNGDTTDFVFWWSDENRLTLADTHGRVTCQLESTPTNAWQGTEVRKPRRLVRLMPL